MAVLPAADGVRRADPRDGPISPMRTLPIRFHRGEHGVTIIELLVALAVFALFILIIDAVFSGARTNAKKIEVAADVQQNVRSAVYRITREVRETNTSQIVTGTDSNGQGQIVFKSARLVADNTVFCLYTKVGSGLHLCIQTEHRSEEHTSELQSLAYLVCRLLLEKKKKNSIRIV